MKRAKTKLDEYEREIVDAFETGAMEPVPNVKDEITKHQRAAADFLRRRKDGSINIRIANEDKDALKIKAKEEGLPYQTLLASIIHKYVTGGLVEKKT